MSESTKFYNISWYIGATAYAALGTIVGLDALKIAGFESGLSANWEQATVSLAMIAAVALGFLSVHVKNTADERKIAGI